jgi:hypothetical protein
MPAITPVETEDESERAAGDGRCCPQASDTGDVVSAPFQCAGSGSSRRPNLVLAGACAAGALMSHMASQAARYITAQPLLSGDTAIDLGSKSCGHWNRYTLGNNASPSL